MPALSTITPVILTLNEAANIERCLVALDWAKRIVVVDSNSEDGTRDIAACFRNVQVFTRTFDGLARQWMFAIHQTAIDSEWVLALDADYTVTQQARDYIASLDDRGISGVTFPFRYAVHGKMLRSGIYPPVTTLYRRSAAKYVQDGHAQKVFVDGKVIRAPCALVHDDRKPLDHWFRTQGMYAQLEAQKLAVENSGLKGWIRTRTPVSPLLIGLYCLLVRGGLFEGRAGWAYALQRIAAEGAIVAAYNDRRLRLSA